MLARDFKLTPAVAKEAVDNMIGPRMWSRGEFNQAELDRMIDGLRLIGDVKDDVNWHNLVDASYLPADLKGK